MTVALVTGAGRGIGLAIARRLATDGHTVVLADREGAGEAAAGVAGATAQTVDLASAEAAEAMASELLDRHGRVDVLVNNAAHLGRHLLEEIDATTLRRFLAVNVEAPLVLSRALAPAMAASGRGRIVNVVSNTVWSPPGPGMIPYVISKGALLGMTRALAVELGPSAITVNAVAPGLIATPGASAGMPDEAFAGVVAQQAIGRPLEPDDIAGAVSYLVSDDAAAVTGQTLLVDGGLVMH